MKRLAFGIFAHIDAGKTTLVEQMLVHSGQLSVAGKIEEGTTESDYLTQEIQRGISIQSTVIVLELNIGASDYSFEVIDNPGHLDFQTQSHASVDAIDCAILLIDSLEGFKSQTLANLEFLLKKKKPILFVLNKIDKPNVDLSLAVVELAELLGKDPHLLFQEEAKGPSFLWADPVACQSELLSLVEWSENLSAAYLESPDDLPALANVGLAGGFWGGMIYPVWAMSALTGEGMDELFSILSWIADQMPSRTEQGAVVFKRQLHPDLGKITYLRAFQPMGEGFSAETDLGHNFTFHTGYRINGRQALEIQSVEPGQTFAIPDSELQLGEWICGSGEVLSSSSEESHPVFQILLEPERNEDFQSLEAHLRDIVWEDGGLKLEKKPETGQLQLSGLGELHLEVALGRLQEIFTEKFQSSNLSVARFELWKKLAQKILFEHSAFEGRLQSGEIEAFVEGISSLSKEVIIDKKYPEYLKGAVESGFSEATASGAFREEILGIRLAVSGYKPPKDPEDPSSLIKVAVAKGLKELLPGSTILIGPVSALEIVVLDENLGDVLGALTKRKGKVLQVDSLPKQRSLIKARVPAENLLGFASVLRNMTQGRGSLSMGTLFDFENYSIL